MWAAITVPFLVYSCAGMQVDQDDGVHCEPLLSEACWGQLASHVDCLLNPRSIHSQECPRLNATELCGEIEHSLRCSSELIEGGCILRSGRENFDFWMRGLEAVATKLCFEGLLQNILSHAHCWDVLRFSHCVEHEDQLHHLVDLLDFPRDTAVPGREQCHRLMLSLSKCAASASGSGSLPGDGCILAATLDVLNELLAAYFSASECGSVCPQPPPPPPETSPSPAADPVPLPSREEDRDNVSAGCSRTGHLFVATLAALVFLVTRE